MTKKINEKNDEENVEKIDEKIDENITKYTANKFAVLDREICL